jgi:hypothetical protein
MTPSHSARRCGSSRRAFLASVAGSGLAATVPLGWYGLHHAFPPSPASSTAIESAMPGKYRGKVVEVSHPHCVHEKEHTIDRRAVAKMIDRGMMELTGADHPEEGWKTFFQRGDVVGIKVNPVGRRPTAKDGGGRVAGAVGCISNPEVIVKIVTELKMAGVRAQDIIIFERYADEFIEAGYEQLMTEPLMSGVRWFASSAQYSNEQVDITGFDKPRSEYSPELTKHVIGYDPDVFTVMDFQAPEHGSHDERRFQSHLSAIVTRMVNKIINVPCLKDHRSAGITGALKNMSHGMNNNVARSHVAFYAAQGSKHDNNRCDYFIPTAVNQQPLKEKATLHILDGLIGVYEGGPGNWNRTWGTWRHQGLFFATDPVALDRVCWKIIDAKRQEMGWLPVDKMGLRYLDDDHDRQATALAGLHAGGIMEDVALQTCMQNLQAGRASEVFSRRQPEHVKLAGELGLGAFAWKEIQHVPVQLS